MDLARPESDPAEIAAALEAEFGGGGGPLAMRLRDFAGCFARLAVCACRPELTNQSTSGTVRRLPAAPRLPGDLPALSVPSGRSRAW